MGKQQRTTEILRKVAYSYIRFSTPDQMAGDSLRRQLEGSQKAAAEHGWLLDESLNLRDLGVSAFRGKNAAEGKLAGFLKAVELGHVKAGSVLIVESLDRLSRDKILKALHLFTGILEAGIEIYTLLDNRLYTAESVTKNPTDLIISITVMMRAHEESETKSKRVSEAWTKKRENASTTPTTAKVPGWISLVDGKLIFNDHVATVRRIVQMALAGHGAVKIAQTLNRENIPVMSRKPNVKHWHYSVVQHVIRTRNLVGEYQPCRMVDGRAVAIGEPVKNYYPAVCTEDQFQQLQAVLATRAKVAGKGRTGRNVANLFGKLLTNANDGGVMILCQKHKENLNMVSLNAANGLAPFISFPYTPFERHFLQWVAEIDVKQAGKTVDRATMIGSQLAEQQAKTAILAAKLDEVGADGFSRLVDMMAKSEAAEKKLAGELQMEQATLKQAPVSTRDIATLVEQMRTAPEDQRQQIRTKLKLSIASVVQSIRIWPYQSQGAVRRLAIVMVKLHNGLVRVWMLQTFRGRTPISASTGYAYSGEGIGFDPDTAAAAVMSHDPITPEAFAMVVAKAVVSAAPTRRTMAAG